VAVTWAQSRLPDSRSIRALTLPASLLGVGLGTFAATIYLMDGMISGPGAELGQLGWFVGAWTLMMAAMMLPSVVPMVLAFARITGERAKKGQAVFVPTWIFILGYFGAWTAFGLAAYLVDYCIRLLDLEWLAWDRGGPIVAGVAVVAAGLYQLTPFKRVCLTHCRAPLEFFLESWREGVAGALCMGMHHGLYCVGCCWGLMLVLFAVGVMSLFWMALIAVLIFAEKVFRAGPRLPPVFGIILIALGLWIAVAPTTIPGLHAPAGNSDMSGMEM
jgi:predicted metal-binding membrane protein